METQRKEEVEITKLRKGEKEKALTFLLRFQICFKS